MSISNLLIADTNSVNIPCNVTGAFTGTTTMNLKRLDNIVYCTFPVTAGIGNNSFSTIIISPTSAIPSRYMPLGAFSRPVMVLNQAVPVGGFVQITNNLSTFTFAMSSLGFFNGNIAVLDDVLLWKVNNI